MVLELSKNNNASSSTEIELGVGYDRLPQVIGTIYFFRTSRAQIWD